MLVLSRDIGESIVIDGRITVRVIRVEGNTVKLGLAAPPSVAIHRQEIYDEIQQTNRQALTRQPSALPKLVRPAPAP